MKIQLILITLMLLLTSCSIGNGDIEVTVANQPENTDAAVVNEPTPREPDLDEPQEPTQLSATQRIAFFGDQGLNSEASEVLKLVKRENAELIIMLGDMGYAEEDPTTPRRFGRMYDSILGADFLTIGVIGNHDVSMWPEYEAFLEGKLNDNVTCTGEYGVKMTCTYNNIDFILSGVGTYGDGHEAYIEESLQNPSTNTSWQICAWHKNQNKLQTGFKANEVGYEAYELCREYGAPVMTGHEHAYSRTFVLDSFETQSVVSTENDMFIKPGESFALVSGLGGRSARVSNDNVVNQNWWAKVATADEDAKQGALFCDFPLDITETEAKCYFKDITGEIVDEFSIIRA